MGDAEKMSSLEQDLREEVELLHRFFVRWFNGTAKPSELEEIFLPRMDDETFFVSPDGHRLERDSLVSMFGDAHGSNPEFRIDVRDVRLLRDLGDTLLITYCEWQRGARASARSDNGRVTTALLGRGAPFKWLHVHETWLPEAEQASGDYAF